MPTQIQSMGSHYDGEGVAAIDGLFAMLAEHPLDRSFEEYGNFAYSLDEDTDYIARFPEWAGHTAFFGNFYDYSFVFNFKTDDAVLIERLTTAIRANQQRPDYLSQQTPAERKAAARRADDKRRREYLERRKRELESVKAQLSSMDAA